MKTFLFLGLVVFLQQVSFAQNYTVKETSFQMDSITIFADIYIPLNPTYKKTGIALIQGSGNSDRTNLWAKSFAEFLAANGYYVLFPDKRGCGKSSGDWKASSFQDLANDAVASVKHLRTKLALDNVGVMGLSQGGFIAPVVAVEDTSINFVINIVGAAVTLEEQIIHEVSNTAKKEGLTPNQIKEVLDLHVLMRDYAINRNWEPLGKRFEELSNSDWADFAATFPTKPDLWIWYWVKMNLNFNPMNYWIKVKQPVFIAYGSKDQEDNMPVYESVYRLQKGFHKINKTNYWIEVYPCGHAMYEDDKAELRKEFLNDLLLWLGNL